MANLQHTAIAPQHIHAPHSWVVADATARAALAPVAADVRKYCLQQDDNSQWMLTNHSPVTWISFGGGVVAWADITGKPAVIAAGADASEARAAIGAGTSNFSGAYADLSGKPTLGTGAELDVPASGNAASGELVTGSDTRLADARTPTTHTHPLSALTDSGATTGQVATYNGTGWAPATPVSGGMTNPMTAAGDMITGGAGGVPGSLAAGTNGHVLTMVAGAPAWAAGGGGGGSFTGGALTSALDEAKGADIARAATTNIGAATGNFVHLTGTTAITALGTVQAGTRRIVRFAGAGTLTHNATSLILPGAANITTAANDCAIFVSEGSGNWRCVAYSRANGQAVAVAAATITGFTSSINTASPNNTVNASRLLASGGSTNQDLVLQPKGTGAIMARLPDGTATGGNKRGAYAIDLQLSRLSASQVASGLNAVAVGLNNTAAADDTFALGRTNTLSQPGSGAVGIGNTLSGNSCFAFGLSNYISADNAYALGSSNYITAQGWALGTSNDVSGVNSLALGTRGTTRGTSGRGVFAGFRRASNGDAQKSFAVLGVETTTTTPATLTTTGMGPASDTNQLTIPLYHVARYEGIVVARDQSGATDDVKSWKFSACLKHTGAGVASVVGTPTVTADFQDAGASSWSVAVSADNTNKSLKITATGPSKAVSWTAYVYGVEGQ